MESAQVTDLERELRDRLRGEVRFDRIDRRLYATDASLYEIEPLGVVLPRDLDDLKALVQIAMQRGIALLPRAGGTSLAGQTVGQALVVDCSKYLHRVLAFEPEARQIEVEPGLVLGQLNRFLAPHGLHFPVDPQTADHAGLGGLVGNNSSGARSLRYGKTVDHVLGVTLLTSDGAERELNEHACVPDEPLHRQIAALAREHAGVIAEGFPGLLRRVSGYNLDAMLVGLRAIGEDLPAWEGKTAPLARRPAGFSLAPLVVGAEGTLGLASRLRLNLVPLPSARALLVFQFDSLEEALEANLVLLQEEPSAIELLDQMLLRLARQQLETARHAHFIQGDPEAMLVLEFEGEPTELPARVERAAARLKGPSRAFYDQAGQESVWRIRKAGLPLLMGMQGRRKPVAFVEDCAVPPESLLSFVRSMQELMREHGTTAAYYAHASVGCLHIRPLLDLQDPGDLERMRAISAATAALVRKFHGSFSGEHGDGLSRGGRLREMFGEEIDSLFGQVKQAFDPRGLMNPGKIVGVGELTEHLRKTPGRVDLPVLNWPEGYARAVEQCNGAGVCRKLDHGTMCPSYMVTRDELHSTRGRANLLRSALVGELHPTSPELHRALELCLECKACRAECPSSVDMARLKTEFLGRWHQHHPVSPRTWLFGHADLLHRLGTSLWPVSNLVSRTLWPLAGLLGVETRRAPLQFSRPFRHRSPARSRQVTLMLDCFSPESVNRAAVEVLEALEYEVVLAPRVCCGRAAISKGLVRRARYLASKAAHQLKGMPPIVGLEPSCILTLRDEFPALGIPEVPSQTFEELVSEHELPLRRAPRSVLLHGHCHQKALVGTGPALKLLGQLPGCPVSEVDSGCCGMAGSFGYEREHYDLSVALAERRLLPAARQEAERGGVVVAAGASCRAQIENLAGLRALHPAELLAQCLR